ncbi:pentatricopeptide repeat-containing protein At3g22670, mitochondrial [Mangifera indica]|uniref:pentatricopeptide repeat-containing protein At3g22670, mitochondrial n=1 Tax=Mangifera indica TaxID=29780 RepID=UPI001CFB2F59|nr:pentatricopeptide repeat-containing protein At3g22670, mitochondrial [Mangifera indica]
MLPRRKIFDFLLLSHSQNKPRINPFRYSLCNPLCTLNESPNTTESPELPTWLRSHDIENPDEDFVIPSLASWVENHKLNDQNGIVSHVFSEKTDTDVDKISKILKNNYPSPDRVVETLNLSCFSVSNSLVEQVLKRFSSNWIPAFGLFTWAKIQTGYKHTPEIYNTMVDILGKTKQFSLMWEVVKEMDELNEGYITLDTMSKVMRRLARRGKHEEAIEAFRAFERYGLKKETKAMNILMDALAKENNVEHAYKVFLEFKGCIPLDSYTFNVLIHGWCKARKLEDAERTMDEMQKHGFVPNVVSYTCFLEHYCREKDFRKAEDILKQMQERGCKPSAVTYTIFVHALGKARQINEALGVYEKMKNDGCLLDASFYSSLIFCLSKAGMLKTANEIFEDMKKQGVMPDVLTFNTMISSACEHLQEEKAFELLRKMEEDSCKPNLETYAPLLKMCCRKKRMKVLNILLQHMFKNDISIDLGTYALLVRGLCKSGKLEDACLFFKEMVSKGMVPMSSTYKMLVEELEKKNLAHAKGKIEKLMSQAREEESV